MVCNNSKHAFSNDLSSVVDVLMLITLVSGSFFTSVFVSGFVFGLGFALDRGLAAGFFRVFFAFFAGGSIVSWVGGGRFAPVGMSMGDEVKGLSNGGTGDVDSNSLSTMSAHAMEEKSRGSRAILFFLFFEE